MAKKPGKSLVIVESPAKAKTLNKILGTKFVVKACMGHVRDLPTTKLGIDIDHDFQPSYRTIKGKTAVLKELKAAAKGAAELFLATDPDREGEAIAWHLAEALAIGEKRMRRITFNEITKRAVLDSFKHPTDISIDLVNAQQARRLLDRIVGYKLSPLLWKKVGRGLSAGRVQSVAVRLVVDREKEIRAFKPDEFWKITATLDKQQGGDAIAFAAELRKIDDAEIDVNNADAANALVADLTKAGYTIESVEQKERRENPPPPFTTSLLQQQASIHLGFSTRKTMMIAQQLYEGVELGEEGAVGMITYMRTDSFRIADEAVDECRRTVARIFGEQYVVEQPRRYPSKKGAQDAHEAIRPSMAEHLPDAVRQYLTDDQFKLYNLIWKRFVSTQMKPALFLDTTAAIAAAAPSGRKGLFHAKGREMKFDGYTAATESNAKKEDQLLPPLAQGEALTLVKLDPTQHFTQPPARFTEASLVKALESHGIGRPSTYAPIISTIQDRGYVRQEERKLHATELGIMVTEKLMEYFDDIMNTDFTANMEEKLDLVEEAKANWVDVLREFHTAFARDLDKATESMTKVKDAVAENGEVCPLCAKPMLVRWNRYGKFLGCSGFPDCKGTKSVGEPEASGQKCEKCGKDMVVRSGRRGRFLACSGYPECKNTRSLIAVKRGITLPPDFDMKCDKCGTAMILRYGRRGPFLACSAYPNCKNTKSIPPEWRKPKQENADATPPAAGESA